MILKERILERLNDLDSNRLAFLDKTLASFAAEDSVQDSIIVQEEARSQTPTRSVTDPETPLKCLQD
jgi:hypothetical protein